MEWLRQDMRYALRALVKSRGFAISSIITLIICIAANTAVFSVLNAVLLNPLSLRHVPDAKRVVVLYERNPSLSSFLADRLSPRHRTVGIWQRDAHSLEQIAVAREANATIQNQSRIKTNQGQAAQVSSNFLDLMGIQLRMGRKFTAADATPGRGQIAIISNSLYQTLFQNDPDILNRSVWVNGHAMRIVGVLPPDFRAPATWGGMNHDPIEVMAPLDQDAVTDPDQQFNLTVFARLRNGYTLEQSRAELNSIAARLQRTNASDYAGFSVNVRRVQDEDVDPDVQRSLLVLQIAVMFVLLIGCANVGNLLLTRAVARDKETAVRLALGAGPWRVVRQILTESVMLSIVAGIAGTALTFAVVRWISSVAPRDVEGFHEIRVDLTVLLFTSGACLLCAVLFALPAIWRGWNVRVNETLNRSSRTVSGSSNRLRTMLAVGQVALSLVLLVGAGLLLRSLQALLDVDMGFQLDHLVSVRVVLPDLRYTSAAKVTGFNQQLLAGLQAIPGIKSAALSTALPMRGISINSFEIPGRPHKQGEEPSSDWNLTTAAYFKAVGVHLLRGRMYTDAEVATSAPVIVINQKFAAEYWPDVDAIGKVIHWGQRDVTIIGEVANEHQAGPDAEGHPEIYRPGLEWKDMYGIARTAGDPVHYADAMRAVVKRLDSSLQPDVQTETAALDEWLAPRKFNMTVISCFAVVALALAAVGLYSLLAYSITLRHREIGIRLAIGADASDVRRMIVRAALAIAVGGIAIGLGCAFALTQFIQSLLFGVSARDPLTFAGVSLLLMCIAVLAAYLPARRASRIDPVEALRQE